jgi:rRNA-processing protein FCF1
MERFAELDVRTVKDLDRIAAGVFGLQQFEDMTLGLGKMEPVIPQCVLDELDKISRGEGKRSRVARVASSLAESFTRLKCLGGDADDCVMDYARKKRAVVATVDAEMIEALKRSRTKVVTLHRGRVAIA